MRSQKIKEECHVASHPALKRFSSPHYKAYKIEAPSLHTKMSRIFVWLSNAKLIFPNMQVPVECGLAFRSDLTEDHAP